MIRIIRSWFTKNPTREYRWCPKDFESAKKWAKSQPHPHQINLSLWDYVSSDRLESEEKLSIINQFVREKLKNDK